MKVVIIGGGIIGLSSAFYLSRAGWDVTVIDKTGITGNCSYGNCGYICPSHFIPLATPGVVKQGLKWMFNSKSPFYVKPSFNRALFDWGWKFMRSATKLKVGNAAVPLRDIALLSKTEYEGWLQMPDFDFAYQQKGLLEIFQTQKGKLHAEHTVHKAHELGLTDTRLLNYAELQSLEPHTSIHALGAILFNCDAHCYPDKLMNQLQATLQKSGVRFLKNTTVSNFETSKNKKISKIFYSDDSGENAIEAFEEVVIATGSWSREIAKLVGVQIPMMPGRGYSLTLENSPFHLNYPAVLLEGRAAVTPMDGNKIRFGGTMEITGHHTPPRMNRVQGILDAVKRFYPEFSIPFPAEKDIWYGYRPCSADGLPYIGRVRTPGNVTIATGHSMLGLSLGAGTGRIVSEIIMEKKPAMDIQPFNPERFA